jgi:hypothetical protein
MEPDVTWWQVDQKQDLTRSRLRLSRGHGMYDAVYGSMYQVLKLLVVMTIAAGTLSASPGAQFRFSAYMRDFQPDNSITIDSVAHPNWDNHYVYVFHADTVTPPSPLICFAPGFNVNHYANNLPLIRHMVGRGCVVAFIPYRAARTAFQPGRAPAIIVDALRGAARRFAGMADTSRVGLVGHSMGASFLPAAASALNRGGWGRRGMFMYVMAPWFVDRLNSEQAGWFPGDMPTVVQVFHDDRVNDHRIALDLFTSLPISEYHKAYSVVFGDSIPAGRVDAVHGTPSVDSAAGANIHPLAVMGVFRVFDALIGATLYRDSLAARFISGGLRDKQRPMRVWPGAHSVRPMVITDTPRLYHPESYYINFWRHELNPRVRFHTFFSARKPFRYRQRLTARNYLKKTGEIARRYARTRGKLRVMVPGDCGSFSVAKVAFAHPGWGSGDIHVYLPLERPAPAPLIALLHGYPWTDPANYRGMIHSLTARGYAVAFIGYALGSPLPKSRMRCDVVLDGIGAAVELFPGRIDTDYVGVVGHGYGGAITPAIIQGLAQEYGWGDKGLFGLMMAPWYGQALTPVRRGRFPDHALIAAQVYRGQRINSWRIARRLLDKLPLDEQHSLFVRVGAAADSLPRANHRLPLSPEGGAWLDTLAIYDIIDAIARAAFRAGSDTTEAKDYVINALRERHGDAVDAVLDVGDSGDSRRFDMSIFW